MKIKRIISLICIFALSVAVLAGCGKSEDAEQLMGDWCYIHDTETVVLSFKSSGLAVFNNKDYNYAITDGFIELVNGNETLKMRYVLEKDDFLLYQTTVYTCPDAREDSITGVWTHDRWAFEFTDEGTFKEDGVFPGQYIVDEEASTIKLIYNDHFVDTICYYTRSGNELTIEYPWTMVRKP